MMNPLTPLSTDANRVSNSAFSLGDTAHSPVVCDEIVPLMVGFIGFGGVNCRDNGDWARTPGPLNCLGIGGMDGIDGPPLPPGPRGPGPVFIGGLPEAAS